MLTLEEAIQHCKEQAATRRMARDSGCAECAAEHEQLAEWLTELKQRRDAEITAPPKSNADRIRQMTDEELAEWFELHGECNTCAYHPAQCKTECNEGHLKWLKQEVGEDETERTD